MSVEQRVVRYWISEVCFWILILLAVGGVMLAATTWLSWTVAPSLAVAMLLVIGINLLGQWAAGG